MVHLCAYTEKVFRDKYAGKLIEVYPGDEVAIEEGVAKHFLGDWEIAASDEDALSREAERVGTGGENGRVWGKNPHEFVRIKEHMSEEELKTWDEHRKTLQKSYKRKEKPDPEKKEELKRATALREYMMKVSIGAK